MPISDFPTAGQQGYQQQLQQHPWQQAMPLTVPQGLNAQPGATGLPMGQRTPNGPQMGQPQMPGGPMGMPAGMPIMGGPLGNGPPQMQRPGMGLLGPPPMAGQPQQMGFARPYGR